MKEEALASPIKIEMVTEIAYHQQRHS